MKKQVVFVGISGGVDSAVSAALLKQATPNNFSKLFGCPPPKGFSGYQVVGVFIRTWHPEFLECNEEEDRRDAMRIAAHLDIPFLSFDLEDVYKKEVAEYMIAEYKVGRTPNPDVMCNKEVKFGAFLKKALAMGADFVATGHYAQVNMQDINSMLSHVSHSVLKINERDLVAKTKENIYFRLAKGNDVTKEQSYFLWTLTQNQLSKILFPIGHIPKTEVRKLAKKFNLPVAEKKDSQGICFLGAIDLKEFLKHYISDKKGKVLNVAGEEIGHHDGVVFHTLGERHGFTITQKSPNDGAYYVVAKDFKQNALTVSTRPELAVSLSPDLAVSIKNTNWISFNPESNKKYTAQVRYHGDFLGCRVECFKPGLAQIVFDKSVLVAPGQSIVLYDKDVCLGGGVVV